MFGVLVYTAISLFVGYLALSKKDVNFGLISLIGFLVVGIGFIGGEETMQFEIGTDLFTLILFTYSYTVYKNILFKQIAYLTLAALVLEFYEHFIEHLLFPEANLAYLWALTIYTNIQMLIGTLFFYFLMVWLKVDKKIALAITLILFATALYATTQLSFETYFERLA